MGKMSDLDLQIKELRSCGETIIGIANTLAGMFSSQAAEDTRYRTWDGTTWRSCPDRFSVMYRLESMSTLFIPTMSLHPAIHRLLLSMMGFRFLHRFQRIISMECSSILRRAGMSARGFSEAFWRRYEGNTCDRSYGRYGCKAFRR